MDEQLSKRSLGYATEQAREQLFDMVTQSYIEAGVSKATIARRLGKDPAQISRLLSASGNWTIDTVAEILFAIDGSFFVASKMHPDTCAKSNDTHSKYLAGPRAQSNANIVFLSYERNSFERSSTNLNTYYTYGG